MVKMFKEFASSGIKIIISRFVFVSERTPSRPLYAENSNPQKIARQCHLLSSYPVGEAVIFILVYLAAILPSSIRHRHTSRGCLWRTSSRVWRTNKEGGGVELKKKKKKSHSSERKDVSGDKLMSVSKLEALFRRGSFSIVPLSFKAEQEFLWALDTEGIRA